MMEGSNTDRVRTASIGADEEAQDEQWVGTVSIAKSEENIQYKQPQEAFTALLGSLQKEVHKLRDETNKTREEMHANKQETQVNQQEMQAAMNSLQQEMRDSAANSEVLKNELRILQEKLRDLAEMQSPTNISSPTALTLNPTPTGRYPVAGTPSIFQQNRASSPDALPPDTFTLMMISPFLSRAWLLGIVTFIFQMVLTLMIGRNQMQESAFSSTFNVPFKVDRVVRIGQLLTIIFALATQNDITTSIRFLLMFWKKDRRWDRTVLKRDEGAPPPTTLEWVIHIFLPNILKLTQGILVMLITFVVIVQSDKIIDLLKDFTALMFLSETDNISFGLAVNGYLGVELQRKTIEAQEIKILERTRSDSNSSDNNNSSSTRDFCMRPIILLSITGVMIGCWLNIVNKQIDGTYFHQRYPDCNFPGAFELASTYFGDGSCYGGPLNTLGCEFEGGDCINFNLAFPLCKGDDRIDVQRLMTNDVCDPMFMIADCDYDGGVCCPYEIINHPSFGDGQCNGGIMITQGCGYDNGDCSTFVRPFQASNRLSQACPLDQLSRIEGAGDIVIGNGICDSGIYNVEECGYEFGECNRGQIGQTIFIPDGIRRNDDLFFSKALSFDGTTMALGLYLANGDGNFGLDPKGMVKIMRYDSTKMIWLPFGANIVGDSVEDQLGVRMDLSSNGNRVAIFTRLDVRVYDFNTTSLGGDWIQVGNTMASKIEPSIGVMSNDGSRVALIHSEDEIRIYDLKSYPGGQRWKYENVIRPGAGVIKEFETLHDLKFNALDGSRLLLIAVDYATSRTLTKVFQRDPNGSTLNSWTQMGQDIVAPSSKLSAVINEDGTRIAVSFNSTSTDYPGEVRIGDYDPTRDTWVLVGDPIKSSSSTAGDGFGYSIDMSSDGNLLVIGSNNPDCQFYLGYPNEFQSNKCTTGSFELYVYHPDVSRFESAIPNSSSPYRINGNRLNLADLSDSSVFGLHFSMNGEGTTLSISGYNFDDENAFVQIYGLDELFYTRCVVRDAFRIGDISCYDKPPYNTEACGFDGGDCIP